MVEYASDDSCEDDSPPGETRSICCRFRHEFRLSRRWRRDLLEILIACALLAWIVPDVLRKHEWLRFWESPMFDAWVEWTTNLTSPHLFE